MSVSYHERYEQLRRALPKVPHDTLEKIVTADQPTLILTGEQVADLTIVTRSAESLPFEILTISSPICLDRA